MKQTKMISFMVCMFTFLAISKAGAQTLVLHHANGTTTDVELYTQPQVKFQDDKVLITSTVLDMEYSKQDVLLFTFKGKATGIVSTNNKADVSQENGQLVFHGIKSADKIAVHNTKGIRMPVNIQRNGSTATLPLTAIPSGVYLLTVNGRTSKFTKR